VRVVGGDLRGRPVHAPEGPDTRPTSDRARQAVFNILEHAPWSDGVGGLRVLDLFAGSGAMGIEALSRGAAACLFVELAEPACAAIRANLTGLGLGDRGRLLKRDATRLGVRPPAEAPYGLVFLDPPYGQGLGERALAGLAEGGWLAPGAVAVLERRRDEPVQDIPGHDRLDLRTYGKAQVQVLRFSGQIR
jgi:16S rRNA (guanine966-N2)-methyltransferase